MPHPTAAHALRLARAIPVLFVADVPTSARFYRDALGFSIDFLHGEPPFYGSVSRDGASLHLKFVHEPVFSVGADDRDALIMVFVDVDNVEALFTECVAAGVTFAQRLQKEPWGGRAFVVRDPDGNMICFAERDPAVSGPAPPD
jgi:catechol 2,3-dioxygenase-like lactoylglutathione lyase family enzyme